MRRRTVSTLCVLMAILSCNGVPEEAAEEELPADGEVIVRGEFVDGVHPTSGTAEVIQDADSGATSLILSDFSSDNGPALYVYLATDSSASDVIDLGALRATSGTLNYAIPEGTYDAKYDNVLIWCEEFSVLFGAAALSPADA